MENSSSVKLIISTTDELQRPNGAMSSGSKWLQDKYFRMVYQPLGRRGVTRLYRLSASWKFVVNEVDNLNDEQQVQRPNGAMSSGPKQLQSIGFRMVIEQLGRRGATRLYKLSKSLNIQSRRRTIASFNDLTVPYPIVQNNFKEHTFQWGFKCWGDVELRGCRGCQTLENSSLQLIISTMNDSLNDAIGPCPRV
jgi:hypothetical protein